MPSKKTNVDWEKLLRQIKEDAKSKDWMSRSVERKRAIDLSPQDLEDMWVEVTKKKIAEHKREIGILQRKLRELLGDEYDENS